MVFEPLIADKLGTMTAPTEEQLNMLRLEIEPEGQVIHAAEWITYKA